MFTNDTSASLYLRALIFDKIDQLSSIGLRKTLNVSMLLNDQFLKIEYTNSELCNHCVKASIKSKTASAKIYKTNIV